MIKVQSVRNLLGVAFLTSLITFIPTIRTNIISINNKHTDIIQIQYKHKHIGKIVIHCINNMHYII
jgi:hypothetical protein